MLKKRWDRILYIVGGLGGMRVILNKLLSTLRSDLLLGFTIQLVSAILVHLKPTLNVMW